MEQIPSNCESDPRFGQVLTSREHGTFDREQLSSFLERIALNTILTQYEVFHNLQSVLKAVGKLHITQFYFKLILLTFKMHLNYYHF